MKIKHIGALALASSCSLLANSAMAGIELGEGLSVTGFVDMDFNYVDTDADVASTSEFSISQVETQFMYTGDDGISAQVDIEYGESGGCASGSSTCAPAGSNDETFVEQAVIAKQVNDKLSVKGGRFLSYSGWETEEPTGLMQYSGTGYGKYFYGGYQQGVSAKYVASGAATFTLSVVNDLANPVDNSSRQLGTELGVHLTPVKGVTAKAFYLSDGDVDMLNVWAAYSINALTFAVEVNSSENTGAAVGIGGTDAEASGYLLMANYATGDYGFTVRYHQSEVETASGVSVEELSGITLSPSYTMSKNLKVVAEYRMNSDELNDNADSDVFSVRALYTF